MITRRQTLLAVTAFTAFAFAVPAHAADKLKALIIDGQNNHKWQSTTPIIKQALEDSGRFTVDISTSPPKGNKDKAAWDAWRPDFKAYDVLVSNYNGDMWPEEVQTAFIDYVKNGGGLVILHAANNSFGGWDEYNKMIGLGGWGGRNEKSGPYVYFEDGKFVRDESKGGGGHHGKQHPFKVTIHDADHPITKGLPAEWMHAQDELYDSLRGPAENMTVLATAYSDPAMGGRGKNEPMMMVLSYGKGRIYHTPMGHADYSMKCRGFQVTTARGAEWAATGKVTIPVPDDFPKDEVVSVK
ncbi:MAG: ThuA domain-containing protein [Phycisphaera sp.]|nr:ThuA domain-containing protein [Phycisphaera sp.]